MALYYALFSPERNSPERGNREFRVANYHPSSTNYRIVAEMPDTGYRLSMSGSSMLRFFALKLMPMSVTGRLPPLYALA